jgi:hypothetical protein
MPHKMNFEEIDAFLSHDTLVRVHPERVIATADVAG